MILEEVGHGNNANSSSCHIRGDLFSKYVETSAIPWSFKNWSTISNQSKFERGLNE